MRAPDSARQRELTRDLLEYFLGHPRAADSLEGILNWRLGDAAVRLRPAEVAEALEWLVENGCLSEHVSEASGRNYCWNSKGRKNAERILTELSRGAGEKE